MSLPPITPAQAVQLGLTAKAAGSVAVSAFRQLLGAATKLLQNAAESIEAAGDSADSPQETGTAGTTPAGLRGEKAVLREQMNGLLQAIAGEIRRLLAGQEMALPPAGITLKQTDTGGVKIEGDFPDRPILQHVLESHERLPQLFAALHARQRLLQQIQRSARPVPAAGQSVFPQAASVFASSGVQPPTGQSSAVPTGETLSPPLRIRITAGGAKLLPTTAPALPSSVRSS